MNIAKLIRVFSIVLFSFLFCLSSTKAQQLSIKWGIEQPYFKRGEIKSISFLKYDNYSIIYKLTTLKSTDYKEFLVKHYQNSGENIIYDLENKYNGSELITSYVDYANGEIEINSNIEHFKTKKVEKYNQVIDTTNLQPKTSRVKLLDADTENMIPELNMGNQTIYVNKSTNASKKDKQGNCYMITQHNDNSIEKDKQNKSVLSLVCYPNNNQKPLYLPLKLPDNCNISSYQLSTNKNNEIVCVGLYSKEGLQSAIGCYSIVVSPFLSEIKSINVKAFSKELIIKGLDSKESISILEKIAENKEFEKNTMYSSSEIHYNKDGSYNIAIEKYRLEREINRNTLYEKKHHYYGDLYVMSFNANGSVKWVQKIPKYAYVINNASVAGSYYLKYDRNDNMYFIFNLIQSNKTFESINNSKTVCVKLDTNGNEKFSELETNTKVSKYICPAYFGDLGDNSIIIVKYNYFTLMPGTGSAINKITFGELNLKQN